MPKGSNLPVRASGLRVEIGWREGPGAPRPHALALLLTGEGRVKDERDLVRAGQPAGPGAAVRHEGRRTAPEGEVETLTVRLDEVAPGIERLAFAVSAEAGAFGDVQALFVRLLDAADGQELARFAPSDATTETAYVLGELYRRHGAWKFRAVGQGWSEGLDRLAAEHGLDVPPRQPARAVAQLPGPATPHPRTPPRTPPPPPAPARPAKVTLTKETPSVSLAKQGGSSGTLHVNLTWRPAGSRQGGGWRAGLARALAPPAAVDLDLCALYELADGRKGVVQALGHAFGSLHRPPWVLLDGDDRSGTLASGENLTVNLDHRAELRRLLVFVTVYEGASGFAGLHATVTLRPRYGAPVEFFLDECTVPSTVCALALLTHDRGELVVRREARYLVPAPGVSPQRTVDQAYGWGLDWRPGRK
ncbi:TerD family protein [Streptomyces sp. NPDC049954]|uniref:TerD family protein n=1 Tax=Streptomyces sp. NPDC049954 TaxID=3155779 RepID=UPI00343CD337